LTIKGPKGELDVAGDKTAEAGERQEAKREEEEV
jgi:hypothetical protein